MYEAATRRSPAIAGRIPGGRGARLGALAALIASLTLAPGAVAAAPTGTLHTVVRGLDNPRGLAFLPGGTLAVAEAGHAGPTCLAPDACGGLTGRISAVDPKTGQRRTLARGFPSIGGPFGPFGLGALAVSSGKLYGIVGENPQEFGDPNKDCQGQSNPSACVALLKTIIHRVGNLVQVRSLTADHGSRTLARVGRFDFHYTKVHPLHGVPPDADPFGLIVRPSGGFYVIDGASNSLGVVSARGGISVLDYVPDPPHHQPIYDAAPTCTVRDATGALIIGTESGMLVRWRHHRMTRLLVGGKVQQVVGCVADAQGNIYLANLDHSVKNFIGNPFTGSVVKVTPQLRTSYIAQGLNYPTGITLGPDGNLYVDVNGLCPADPSQVNSQNAPAGACPGSGRVVRIETR